jgi:hypothetical protein
MPSEALALGLNDPDLKLPDESKQVQGVRTARYCQRHNIVLPPWIDIAPIAGRAIRRLRRCYSEGICETERESEATSEDSEG